MMVGVGIVMVVLAYAALAIYLTIVYHRNPCERTAPTQLSAEPACSRLSRFDSRLLSAAHFYSPSLVTRVHGADESPPPHPS